MHRRARSAVDPLAAAIIQIPRRPSGRAPTMSGVAPVGARGLPFGGSSARCSAGRGWRSIRQPRPNNSNSASPVTTGSNSVKRCSCWSARSRAMQRRPGSAVNPPIPAFDVNYSIIFATTPAPTVRPPSRIAKRRPSSIAIGAISSTTICTLSPGITISVPSGSSTAPVTSVVRK